MCDKRYDLDSLDGIDVILRTETKSAGGGTKPQVISTHNNNTQLLPNKQQQLQDEQLQLLKGPQRADELVAAKETDIGSCKSTTSTQPSILHQANSKLFSNSMGQTITTSIGPMLSWRNEHLMTCMLITANVGTIFEESTLLELWFEQLKSYLIKIKPQMVAIHCQEVGGKNFETSMKNVSCFTDKILGDDKIVGDYSRVRIFLDENFECLEKFTALGSLYLVHDSVDNVKLYNFKTAQYDNVEGRGILAAPDKRDLLEHTTLNDFDQKQNQQHKGPLNKLAEHVEKIKFPLELFPECRWSRKGFMRTRWLFNDCQPLDLVNIHLFHDASNLVAMKTTPSPYAQNRQKALEFALSKVSETLPVADNNNRGQASQNLSEKSSSSDSRKELGQQHQVPLFIFGDFNFRLDTSRVIQRITKGISPVVKKNANSDEVLEIVYQRNTNDCAEDSVCDKCDEHKTSTNIATATDEDNGCEKKGSGVVMTVGKKLFDYRNLDETFRATKNTEWLLELDNELDSFKSQLYEFKISFSPSYPFREDQSGGCSYMKTRCPAWCDRILFNEAGYRLISGKTNDAWQSEVDSAAEVNLDSERRFEILQDQGDVIYRLMGNSVPMGDHKPVLLYCHLNISQKDQQHQQNRQQNPSSKCNQTVMSTTTGGPQPLEDNLVESTAM